jgi:ribonuclease HI
MDEQALKEAREVEALRARQHQLERELADICLEIKRRTTADGGSARVLYVDGGCTGNSQREVAARRMVMVVTDEQGVVLAEATAHGGSNNIAELAAVRDALAWCVKHEVDAVEVRTDSRVNLAWVLGAKVGQDITDRTRVLALKEEIAACRGSVRLRLTWVPRARNLAGHYIERHYGC